jgi:predicted ArsR family transcriptional regulator
VDLTPQAETLLRHMADEHPTIDLDDAATETGLTPTAATRAMRQLCEGGYAKEREQHAARGAGLADQFDITASGRRTASRFS